MDEAQTAIEALLLDEAWKYCSDSTVANYLRVKVRYVRMVRKDMMPKLIAVPSLDAPLLERVRYICQQTNGQITREYCGRMGITDATARRAKEILTSGDADLIAATEEGLLQINTAARLAKTPIEQRQRAIAVARRKAAETKPAPLYDHRKTKGEIIGELLERTYTHWKAASLHVDINAHLFPTKDQEKIRQIIRDAEAALHIVTETTERLIQEAKSCLSKIHERKHSSNGSGSNGNTPTP